MVATNLPGSIELINVVVPIKIYSMRKQLYVVAVFSGLIAYR